MKALRAVNAAYRANDDSHLWPICNRFNVTERAIRRTRKIVRETGECDVNVYALMLEDEMSEIVNNERNW